MKRVFPLLIAACVFSAPVFAGLKFGLQAGVYSPTKGIDDGDNGIVLGGDLRFKFTVVGFKIEAFYVDSSGRLEDELGSGFGEAEISVKNMFNADFMWFPLGTTFFAQAGVNLVNYDVDEINQDVIDNELGIEFGLGASVFDKLLVLGKILYTPNAIEDDAVDTITGLDSSDVRGYMVTIGWHF